MLPKIPYIMRKNKQQVVAMGGVNYSSVLRDGDIADSKGISARAYPYLTTAKGRRKLTYSGVSAMTVFQGKLVTVKGTELYWGGELIGKVIGGEKQFAAVNTKLCIMPDKVYLDATDGKLKPMSALVIGGGGEFTKNSVTVNNDSVVAIKGIGGVVKDNMLTVEPKKTVWDGRAIININDNELAFTPVVSASIEVKDTNLAHIAYVYFDHDNFSGEVLINGQWERAEGEYNYDNNGLDLVFASHIFKSYQIGSTFAVECGQKNPLVLGDVVDLSFGDVVITDTSVFTVIFDTAYVSYQYNGHREIVGNGTVSRKDWESLKTAFSVGDSVGIYDPMKKEYIKTTVSAVTDTTLTFADEVSDFTEVGLIALYSNLAGTLPNLGEKFKVGDVVAVKGGSNDISFRIDAIEGNILRAGSDIFTSETVEGVISVERAIPTLDYICESNNRLWGCSNADRTIYASALGDPTNIYTYQGVSTDSFAVAVGSEEDFTACIGYGDAVLFFKEMKLHKILGSYPAEYTMYSYDFEGVQKGCSKSLAIVNEVLYYKGIHGVFAYTGSPALISSNFGEREFFNAVGGTDGDTYYLSVTDGADLQGHYLFAYETQKRLWVLEDKVKVTDFARVGGSTYMLTGGEVYVCGAEETPADAEWFVQFTPLYETIDGRKSYSRILLRLELPEGSHIVVQTRFDGGIWMEAGKVIGSRQTVVPVMIPINRCDKFEIAIKGKGKATILSMLREYYVRSDR